MSFVEMAANSLYSGPVDHEPFVHLQQDTNFLEVKHINLALIEDNPIQLQQTHELLLELLEKR